MKNPKTKYGRTGNTFMDGKDQRIKKKTRDRRMYVRYGA
jgi:hypothetical protein